MENILIKVIMIINGASRVHSLKCNSNLQEHKKLLNKIKKQGYSIDMLKNYIKNNNIAIENNSLKLACPSCSYMLSCPKVLDSQKKDIRNYPFVLNGIQLMIIDKDKNKIYKDAIKEYQEKSGDLEFNLSNDFDLLDRLSDDGIDVVSTYVFDCKKYVHENLDRNIPKREKDEIFGIGYSKNKKFSDANSIDADIKRIRSLFNDNK